MMKQFMDHCIMDMVVKEHILQHEEEQNLAGAMTLEGVMSSIASGEAKELNWNYHFTVPGQYKVRVETWIDGYLVPFSAGSLVLKCWMALRRSNFAALSSASSCLR